MVVATMSLYVHRAERADRLANALGELLSTPLDDPFAAEIVSVPTRGVERWLAQRLSHQLGAARGQDDGICAGVEFPSPRRLTARAMSGVLDLDAVSDPWQPSRAVWPLLRVIDAARGEQWLEVLWAHLGNRRDRPASGELARVRSDRRWAVARHLADLFDDYASSRAGMLTAWLRGEDVDGLGQSLAPDRAWQAELWRRLHTQIGVPGPAERLQAGIAELAGAPERTDLPSRVSLFGATRIRTDQLLILGALARHRDVHLWLPNPSPVLWSLIAAQPDAASIGPRAAHATSALARHPLLGALGRDSRELQQMLAASGELTGDRHIPSPGPELPRPKQLDRPPPEPVEGQFDEVTVSNALLHRLQDDIATNRAPRPFNARPLLNPSDRSVQFHASHGPDRQVEVLRELLVGLLADDETLEPRDILVLCPDIETYAPLIAASFGLDVGDSQAEHPGHRLRVRLADRSLRQLNPLLSVLSRLVSLAESRMEASVLLDFCTSAPVARKFGFSTDDLERLQELVAKSGVRWGLDAHHRRRFGMSAFAQNTWAAGLDRLLLGVTMDETEEHFLGTALPLDDVESSDVDLLGRLVECLDRVRTVIDGFAGRQPLGAWCQAFRQAIELLTAVTPNDSWQLAHAYAELGSIDESATDTSSNGSVDLSLPEIAALLADTFRGRASRANFRTGTLTMCTMLPMRSVPHRVVCLLGVDDGVFPRHVKVDGDDILALDPWIGDRDPRSEDRQLLLDAIMAAVDHLIVVYAGMDPRTGAHRPPAVPIGELLDALDATARTTTSMPIRTLIVTEHPLQPFDPDNFGEVGPDSRAPANEPEQPTRPGEPWQPKRLGSDGQPFSFDQASWRGARASVGNRSNAVPVFGMKPLPTPPDDQPAELASLVRFYAHPIRALLRERAGLRLRSDEERAAEQIPITFTGLDRWNVGDRLLRRHLSGQELKQLTAAEWRRGWLPPRSLGSAAITEVADTVRELKATAASHLTETACRYDVSIQIGETVLAGTVPKVHGSTIVRVTYSFLSAKQRLQTWIELLALTAGLPGHEWRAAVIGRGGSSILGPVEQELARNLLTDLAELRRTGLCEPLPFSPKTSAEYARIRVVGKTVELYARKLEAIWLTERDREYESFFGPRAGLAELMRQPSLTNEERAGTAEPSRFGTLARRIYEPLLAAETTR